MVTGKTEEMSLACGPIQNSEFKIRNSSLVLFTLFLLCLALPVSTHALDVPQLKGHVNDYAGMLSPSEANRLEAKLTGFEKTDSTQVVVLIIPSLEGEDLEGYSIKVAETWKIGWKGLDNGVILLISRDDKKIRIEVGRGLEGKLTDLISGRIIRTTIVPHFKTGDFDGGVEAGTTAIIEAVRGEFKAKDRGSADGVTHGKSAGSSMFTLAIFLVIALLFLAAVSRIIGAIAGAVGLPVVGWLAFGGLSVLVLGVLAVAGLLLGLFFGFLAGHRGSGWGGGPFIGGGGLGGWSGSDSGGGSDFGGGGGDFGGGGASGDW